MSDFYPTPPYAIWPLLQVEAFGHAVWEPACGDGAISKVLESIGVPVISTDLHAHGYGRSGVDFLRARKLRAPDIATNPPFKLANAFVRKAHDLGARRIIMLLRLAFLEGVGRSDIIEHSGLCRVHVFRERVTMYPKGEDVTGVSTTAFAWFVWERGYCGKPEINRISVMRDAA